MNENIICGLDVLCNIPICCLLGFSLQHYGNWHNAHYQTTRKSWQTLCIKNINFWIIVYWGALMCLLVISAESWAMFPRTSFYFIYWFWLFSSVLELKISISDRFDRVSIDSEHGLFFFYLGISVIWPRFVNLVSSVIQFIETPCMNMIVIVHV